MEPRISIVIPTYNNAQFLPEAIESALNQTYKNREVILVDDGSTNDTWEVVNRYWGGITYIRQPNRGPGAARNRGLEASTGEWVGFLDSDDVWEREHLRAMVDKMQLMPEARLIYCGKRWVDSNGEEIESVPLQQTYPEGWIFPDLFEHNYISSSSCVLASRAEVISIGGFKSMYHSESYDLWIRMALSIPFPVYRSLM